MPLVALVMVVNASALGYRLTEGWDWGDCYWMVAITIPTIGYGEVEPLSHAGRVVTVFSIVGGLVVVQLTIRSLVGVAESGYFRRLHARRLLHWLQTMNDHVILCGYGRIGREIAAQLSKEGTPLLVVEMDPDRRDAAEAKGLPVLLADATLDETLVDAGIHRCRSLVAALPNDAANVYVVLSARAIAPRCRLIARSDSEEAERKLRQAGADQVVSPYVAGAARWPQRPPAPWRSTSWNCSRVRSARWRNFNSATTQPSSGTSMGAPWRNSTSGAAPGPWFWRFANQRRLW